MLKPSSVPVEGIEVSILEVEERPFLKYGSASETENLVAVKVSHFDDWLKLSPDNFVTIAKHLDTWDFSKWPTRTIRIYQESKIIRESTILMVRVGEKIKRASRKNVSK